MTAYKLIRIGRLLATRASIEGSGGRKLLTLLVDTGSTYTIIPVEALEAIGSSPAESKDHVRIITGSGVLIAPRVSVPAFHCLGRELKNCPLVGHSLPASAPIDGLLGMDVLTPLETRIDLQRGLIEVS